MYGSTDNTTETFLFEGSPTLCRCFIDPSPRALIQEGVLYLSSQHFAQCFVQSLHIEALKTNDV